MCDTKDVEHADTVGLQLPIAASQHGSRVVAIVQEYLEGHRLPTVALNKHKHIRADSAIAHLSPTSATTDTRHGGARIRNQCAERTCKNSPHCGKWCNIAVPLWGMGERVG